MNNFFDDRPCLTKQEIELYLNGNLSDQQRFNIENHMLDCPLCSDAVEGLKQSPDVLGEMPEDLPESNLGVHPSKHEIVLKPQNWNWYRMAAVFTGLIVFSALIYQYFTNTQSQKIFADAYNLLPPPDSRLRSVGDSVQAESTDQAMIYYGQKKFDEAVKAFEDRLKAYPNDSQTYLYAGICYLETGNLNKASDYLMKARINSEQFYPEASWYLALAKIRSGSYSDALKLLEELTASENDYTQKAKELQTELNR